MIVEVSILPILHSVIHNILFDQSNQAGIDFTSNVSQAASN